jgi:protein arginine N-methyltransferase 3
MDFDDEWSDDDEPAAVLAQSSSKPDSGRVSQLEVELEKARADVKRLQNLVQEMTNDEDDIDGEQIVLGPGVKSNGKGKGKGVRDDDTHYFDSYEHNG